MPPGPEPLPDFDAPPVVETVLSVQFEPLPLVQTAHLGLLWNEYRSSLPKTEERPSLDPVVEQFPERPSVRVGLKFQAFENPPVPRLWFANPQGNETIRSRTIGSSRIGARRGTRSSIPATRRPSGPSLTGIIASSLHFWKRTNWARHASISVR